MGEKPIQSLKRKKDSSLVKAIELVKQGKCKAVISCGNTGSLMAGSTLKLRPLPGVERPALAAVMPAKKELFLLLVGGDSLASASSRTVHAFPFDIKPVVKAPTRVKVSTPARHVPGGRAGVCTIALRVFISSQKEGRCLSHSRYEFGVFYGGLHCGLYGCAVLTQAVTPESHGCKRLLVVVR